MMPGWNGVVAAFCTCLLGLGLARFAYTPLIPALIGAHWFLPGQAAYLGAANIAGYLLGAVSTRALSHRFGTRATLRLCLVAATAQFFACMDPASFAWFAVWRFVSGLAGAGLMVLAAPLVLPRVAPRHRGLAGGIIFAGIGCGILAAGTVLPVLLRQGLGRTWFALGLAACAASATAWCLLPPDAQQPSDGAAARPAPARLRWLVAAYAISAAGQVPVILFLADFAARGLHLGVQSGAALWAWAGVGALLAPLLAGLGADRLGHSTALRLLWFTQIAANAALLAAAWNGAGQGWTLALASAVAGGGIPALVVLVLGRSQALAGRDDAARAHAWSRATIGFALGQAAGAYGLSALFAAWPRYDWLFFSACVCMGVALLAGERAAGGVEVSEPAPVG